MAWLTTDEAAAYLKVRPRTLQSWARQGRVPAHQIPGCGERIIWRFDPVELDDKLRQSPADVSRKETK